MEFNDFYTRYSEDIAAIRSTQNIHEKHINDMHKEIGALKKAPDSIVVDSTNKTIDEVVEEIIEIIEQGMCIKPINNNWISDACDKQIDEILKMFVGGVTNGLH